MPRLNYRLASLLFAALAFRLAFVAAHGFKYDVDAYSNWATILATHGPLAIYGPLPQPPVDYPPGYLYVLWAVGIAHAAFGGGALALHVWLKLVPIVADLAIVWLSYRAARRLTSERTALVLAAVVAFAPPLWLDSVYWGQSDSVPAALLFAALPALVDASLVRGLFLFALSVIVKPQGILAAPAVLVLCERARHPAGRLALALAAALGASYVATLPFTTARDPVSVFAFLVRTYADGVAMTPFTSNGAFNLYTLLTGYRQNDATTVAAIPYRVFGVALVTPIVIAIAIALARSLSAEDARERRLPRVLGASSLSLLTFFVFATRVHERYLLPALILGAPLAVEDRPTAVALGYLALSFTLNCAYSFKGLYAAAPTTAVALFAKTLALGNIIAFATLTHRQLTRTRIQTHPRNAASGENSRVRIRG